MLKTVFGYSPQVKTIDFLLSTYDGYFNKTQIANGAKISRPTLNKFIENLLEYGILKRIKGNTFELNNDSEIVKLFAKANLLLVEMELDKKSKNHVYEKIDYSVKELDDLMDDLFHDEENLSEEEYQEKIAEKERKKGKVFVSKKEYDFLLEFYQENKKISHAKMSENMEKIISEASSEVIKNMSKVVQDMEQKASERINQELSSANKI